MPTGSFIRDTAAPDLAAGVTLNAAGTTNSTVATAAWPLEAAVEIRTGTVTGTSPTMTVVVQSSSSPTFASDVISHGTVSLSGGSQSNVTRYLDIYGSRKFMRAAVTLGGTSPVYTGTTIRVVKAEVGRDNSRTA
jgi:hypothetical protein